MNGPRSLVSSERDLKYWIELTLTPSIQSEWLNHSTTDDSNIIASLVCLKEVRQRGVEKTEDGDALVTDNVKRRGYVKMKRNVNLLGGISFIVGSIIGESLYIL